MEAVELFLTTKNHAWLGWALQSLGIALREKGELEQAAQRLREALDIGIEVGSDNRVAFCHQALGEIALLQDQLEEARTLFEGSIRFAHRSGDQATAAWAFAGLGDVALARGSMDEAREYYERAMARFEELDQKIDLALLTEKMARVSLLQGNDSQAILLNLRSLGLYREIGYTPGLLQVLVRIAEQNIDRRENGRAIKILGGISARISIDGSKEPNLLKRYEETTSKARACAKDKDFGTFWRLGNSLSNEELVDLAREYEPTLKFSKQVGRKRRGGK
jgi:tetratricopeptide (TPR) repeat protein